MSPLAPFHLALPVDDLAAARRFYVDILGCKTGRQSDRWLDFDFLGHQVVTHLVDELPTAATNHVDGEAVPAFHFGLVLGMPEWEAIVERLREHGVDFLIEPQVRFRGQPGEQATCFVRDPAGNALEFKAMRRPEALFEA